MQQPVLVPAIRKPRLLAGAGHQAGLPRPIAARDRVSAPVPLVPQCYCAGACGLAEKLTEVQSKTSTSMSIPSSLATFAGWDDGESIRIGGSSHE
jgi:hypothetical protein